MIVHNSKCGVLFSKKLENILPPEEDKCLTHIFVARNWNVLNYGCSYGTLEPDYEKEYSIHNEKRKRYRERCAQDITKMKRGSKIRLILSEFNLKELENLLKLNKIQIINKEDVLCRKKKKRIMVTFRK